MPTDTIVALVAFAFVMSISPGPGNFLLLASGVNFGFARSAPLILGISLGFLAMVFVIGLGLGQILREYGIIYTGLKVVCAAYVLWLAAKIARSRSLSPDTGKAMDEPISFTQAAFFQLANPKAWAVALIVTVSYTNPENYLASLVVMIAIFAVVNLPSISVWALSGMALRRLAGDGTWVAVFNVAMAVLLVGSMVPVIFGTIGG